MTRPLTRLSASRRAQRPLPLRRAGARRLITELNALHEIGRAISSQWNLKAVLDTIYAQTSRLMDTRHFYIALYDHAERSIQFPVFVDDGQLIEVPPRHWSTGITEWMLLHRRPVRRQITDLDEDIAPIAWGSHSKSYLGVPIMLRDEPLGVISVQSVEHEQAFSERDEAILLMVADQAAIAIANALRYEAVNNELERRVAELEALEATARDLNATLHLDTMLERLVQRLCALTSAEAGMVCLVSDDKRTLKVRADQGYPDTVELYREGGWSLSWGISGKVARSGVPDWSPDVRLSQSYHPTRPTTQSQMTIPISHNNTVLGVLVLESDRLDAFTPQHLGFVTQIAEHAALSVHNARVHDQALRQQALLTQRSQQLNEVMRISQALSASLDLNALLPEIVRSVQSSLGFNIALLSLLDRAYPPRMVRRAAAGIPAEKWEMLKRQFVPLEWYKHVMRDEFRLSRSYFIPHTHSDHHLVWNEADTDLYRPNLGERSDDEWHAEDSLFVPLLDSEGELLGVLAVDDPRDRRVPALEALQVLEIFATQAAIAIENASKYAATQRLAITDGLTSLYNQRHFGTLLEQEVLKARRHQQPLALMAFDLDKFKSYNDTYGHLEGNVLLREFSQLLRSSVRETDIVARNGGEEFAVILPQTDAEGAMLLAERVRSLVASYPFPHRPITVSIGVGVLQPKMDSLLLQEVADMALYKAKSAGRNTIVLGEAAPHSIIG
ncbi:MAG TPA: diguanylate cyclase [Herpetosiphonaceae bacterium]